MKTGNSENTWLDMWVKDQGWSPHVAQRPFKLPSWQSFHQPLPFSFLTPQKKIKVKPKQQVPQNHPQWDFFTHFLFSQNPRDLKKTQKATQPPPHPPKNKALQCVVAVIVGRGCISKQGKWSAASLVSNTEKSRSDPVCLKEEMSKYWDIIGTLWWGVLFVWQTDGLYLGQNENKESSDTCIWYISGPYFTFLTQNIIPIFRTLCKGLQDMLNQPRKHWKHNKVAQHGPATNNPSTPCSGQSGLNIFTSRLASSIMTIVPVWR